jgi:hypothetical protein
VPPLHAFCLSTALTKAYAPSPDPGNAEQQRGRACQVGLRYAAQAGCVCQAVQVRRNHLAACRRAAPPRCPIMEPPSRPAVTANASVESREAPPPAGPAAAAAAAAAAQPRETGSLQGPPRMPNPPQSIAAKALHSFWWALRPYLPHEGVTPGAVAEAGNGRTVWVAGPARRGGAPRRAATAAPGAAKADGTDVAAVVHYNVATRAMVVALTASFCLFVFGGGGGGGSPRRVRLWRVGGFGGPARRLHGSWLSASAAGACRPGSWRCACERACPTLILRSRPSPLDRPSGYPTLHPAATHPLSPSLPHPPTVPLPPTPTHALHHPAGQC